MSGSKLQRKSLLKAVRRISGLKFLKTTEALRKTFTFLSQILKRQLTTRRKENCTTRMIPRRKRISFISGTIL